MKNTLLLGSVENDYNYMESQSLTVTPVVN